MPSRRRTSRSLLAGAVLVAVLSGAMACTGSDSQDGASPTEALAKAKQTLDDTSGVRLDLRTDNLPDGVTGVQSAEGVATHDPAFDGTITVVLSGQALEVPVVAVGGKVYAQLPLTAGWQDVDPADYGAPDPADLMDPDHGFSSLLTATTDVQEGDSVRGGEDNKEVLTEYSGTVGADAVRTIIPTASGEFDATYTVAEDGELRSARLTGVFYPDSDPMSYVVQFEDYGTDQQITAP